MTRNARWTWLLLCAALFVGCWQGPYPEHMFLQHIPTVLALAAAPWLYARWPISDVALACLGAFVLLHIVGARYVYSFVPYDDWLRAVFGTDTATHFGWQRNHYDRWVHFAFGVLFVRPLQDVGVRHIALPRGVALCGAVLCVLAVSLLYELFEWSLTLWLAGDAALTYNGQQGDAWDAQKDMALASLGALVGAVVLRVRERERN